MTGAPNESVDRDRSPGARLDSWKEIATYLNRHVTTVRRWEKQEGLPVHRHRHDKLGSVYAFQTELDEWWHRRRSVLEPDSIATQPDATTRSQLSTRMGLGLLVLLLAAFAGTYVFWRPTPLLRPGVPLTLQSPMRLLPVTSLTGWLSWPALSPNSDQVAFNWAGEQNDNLDIYVAIVGSPDVRRLTTHPAADFAPSWSPNGREIAFLRREHGATRIHVISALGGSDRTLGDFPAWATINWSPDGRFIVAGRVAPLDAARGIYLVPVEGGEPRAIAPMRVPAEGHAPAFSPDGHRLAYVRCETLNSESLAGGMTDAGVDSQGCHIMLVDVDDSYGARSAPRRLTPDTMNAVAALAWSRDGMAIVFSGHRALPHKDEAGTSDDGMDHLWRIPAHEPGAPERIEIAGLNARSPTLSHDRLVFSRAEEDIDIFRLVRGQEPQRFLTSAFVDLHASFSDDGRRIAFCSDRTGTVQIWVAAADGTSTRQVTRGPSLERGSPKWSPDGFRIAFDDLEANGDRHIWTIGVEGTAARQLTTQRGEQASPTWSHDGQWIYFSQDTGSERDVWRVRSTGGSPEQLSRSGSGIIAFESADGRSIIYKLADGDGPLVEASLTGDLVKPLVACVASYRGFRPVGDAIYYVPCGPTHAGSIWVLDRKTGRTRPWAAVPDVETGYLWDLAISPDATTLLYDRFVNRRSNLWALENFR